MVSSNSINTKLFVWFIDDVWSSLKDEEEESMSPLMFFGNSSVHSNNEATKFMAKRGIPCITIPPYSPRLNAPEKVIALIKSKLQNEWIRGRWMGMGLIQKIVGNITPEQCNQLVKSSRIEVLKNMKILKNSV